MVALNIILYSEGFNKHYSTVSLSPHQKEETDLV